MEQRYKRPADWSIISAAAETVSIPVIGNGDLLTNFEVAHRKNSTPTHALMTGRGALVKPWIFEEARTVRTQIWPCISELHHHAQCSPPDQLSDCIAG